MRVLFLGEAKADLAWFRAYYGRVFPAGAERARDRLTRTFALIARNPELGRPGDTPPAREHPVPGIPFTLIYVVRQDRIEVLRLLDQRAAAPGD